MRKWKNVKGKFERLFRSAYVLLLQVLHRQHQQHNFQIYDEEAEKRSAAKTPIPSSTVMDEIISRAASMSVSNRKQNPEGTNPDVRFMEDTEILNIMFDTLSTALEVADARKFSYTNAAVANHHISWRSCGLGYSVC
jgi:hypothetical protein